MAEAMGDRARFVTTAPRVFVIGATMPRSDAMASYLDYRGEFWRTDDDGDCDSEMIVEAAGRVCYQSWRNPAKRSRRDYIQEQIVGRDHLSVTEHVSVNLLCADVPRSTQLETVRHRVGVAYSWESTRFTDKHLRFVVPPRVREDEMAAFAFRQACQQATEIYELLKEEAGRATDEGTLKRKRANEAARSVLPNALGSDGLFTLNGHALRHFLAKRSDVAADLSMREFAYAIYQATRPLLPALLADAREVEAEHVPQIVFGGGGL